MKCFVFLALLLFPITAIQASDSLQVTINRSVFAKGDSIDFTCTVPNYADLKLKTATLNVWIEDIGRNKRWKFRYPMLDGETSATLVIGDNIPDGRYALNFVVQHGFFRLSGEVIDPDKKDSVINYMMMVKNKKGSYLDNTKVAEDGSFRLKSTLFEDSAYFIFSPAQKVKTNDLNLRIETPLDSFFVPVVSDTKFITVGLIGNNAADQKLADTTAYSFTTDEPADKTLLPGVTVTTRARKKVEQFNDEYSRGLFQRDDAMIFDGIDDGQIARSLSVYQFLQNKVPGLSIERGEDGQEYARWRNEVVELYIDEFKMDSTDNFFVRPADIAMIKVYRPPANLSPFSGGAGAIAIYTKRGRYGDAANRSRHNFVVKGYTAMESRWEF